MTIYIGAWFIRLITMIILLIIGMILSEIDVKRNEGPTVFFILLWFAVVLWIIVWMP